MIDSPINQRSTPQRGNQLAGFWRRKPLENVLSICLLIAIAAFACHAVGLLYDGRYSVTRQDYWRIYLVDLRLAFPLNALQKHNDHPVFFPSLIWLTVLRFFANNQTLLFFCGLTLTLATLVLLLVSLWSSKSLGRVERLSLALIYTVGCLWVGKANITASGGFSCMNSLTMTAFVAGLLCLHGLSAPTSAGRRAWLFSGTAVAALVASLSFGTGIAAWPAFALLAMVNRLRWKVVAGLGFGGFLTAIIVVSLPNVSDTQSDAGGQLLANLPTTLVRFAQLLGAPWFYYGSGWLFPEEDGAFVYLWVGLIGLVGLGAAIYFLFGRVRSRRIFEPGETVALGMMLAMLGSIALVAIGRSGLLVPNPHEVLAPRYFYWSAFFWAALPALAIYSWPGLRASPGALCLVAIALAGGAIPSQISMGQAYSLGRRTTESAALQLVCGAEDEKASQRLFRSVGNSGALIYRLARQYRQLGLDMYAWPGATLVGESMGSVEAKMKSHPHGVLGHWQVAEVFPLPAIGERGARFSGWCVTRKTHRTPDYVLICQGNGRIVGLGRFTLARPEKNQKYHLASDRLTGFEGYIQNYSETRHYICRVIVDGELVQPGLKKLKTKL